MKKIYTLLMATIIIISGCKKDETSTGPEDVTKTIPVLTTTEVSNITSTTAKSGGNVTNDGGALVTSRGVCWGTNQTPTISNSKTTDGEGAGTFTSTITGLAGGTKYYVRAYATNSIGTSYGNQLSFTTTTPAIIYGTLTFNGFTYTTVTIGTQEWTVENLRTTTYNDGTAIPKVTDGTAWSNLTTGAYCAYNNDETNVTTYGYLYNWYAVNTGKLAPTTGGWHVPTDADWTKLTDYVGGSTNAGTKLKAKSGWSNSGNGTDDFGFSALPGGYRDYDGDFRSLGRYGNWWSSTAADAGNAWYRYVDDNDTGVDRNYFIKRDGFSVRLVRDK